jgi:O-antigen ligase
MMPYLWSLAGLFYGLWFLPLTRVAFGSFNADLGVAGIALILAARLLLYPVSLPHRYLGVMSLSLLFTLSVAAALAWGDPGWGFRFMVKLTVSVLLFNAFLVARPRTADLQRFYEAALLSTAVVVIILGYRYLIVFGESFIGVAWNLAAAEGKNQLALYLGVAQALALSRSVFVGGTLNHLVTLVLTLAGIGTQSRGAFLVIGLNTLATLLIASRKAGFRRRAVALLGIALGIGLVISVETPALLSFASKRGNALFILQDPAGEHSLQKRLALSEAAWKAFLTHPLLGVGTGSFRGSVSMQLTALENVTHNDYLAALAEQGLLGGVVFCMLIAKLLAFALRTINFEICRREPFAWLRVGLAVASIGCIVHSFTENQIDVALPWLTFAGLLVTSRLAGPNRRSPWRGIEHAASCCYR